VLNYARSQVYYQPIGQPDAPELEAAIVSIAGGYATYGYRRITAQLRHQGHCVNHKRVACRIRQMGIMAKARVKRKRTTNREHRGQAWVFLNRFSTSRMRPDTHS
jgi:transposase InsO family protein